MLIANVYEWGKWFLVANVQITKTITPLPKKGLAPILIALPQTYIRNPGNY